ncbi:MAG TPA: pyridoxamine 5'-phosphate oxidase family protein [Acidimicrobiales bacterium]|jgi:PPOX class probable F420-dependent enzyme|nr:pyridoxamine 5'-phosphate oxidase family protein [Acidimicrobiales bacterium]
MTDEEVEAFLDGRHTMNVATIGPAGRIHLVAMWYGFLEGAPAFWTYGKSQKILNLRRDPRITALVETGEQYEELRGVELVGTGTIVEDRERIMELGRSVFERYTGPYTDEMAPVLEATGAKRLVVKLEIESVVSWDHGKLGGRY